MESVLGLSGKLVGDLISPVFKKYITEPWAHGSKDEFEKLKKTMFAIKAVLLDAEERQQTNNQIQHWLREIKLVFYDVEDLLQEVTTKALMDQAKTRQRKRGVKEVLISYSHPNTPVVRLNMGSKVKSIRKKLDAIFLDSKMFDFTRRDESRSKKREEMSKKREETHSFMPVEKFIGREDDKKYVTKLLVESDVIDNVSVVSLVGVGGIGKTTLAKSVYNSEEIKSKFDLRAWVCVSNHFYVKLICENIVMSVTHSRCDGLPMEVVKDKLESSIHGRKYLLVLDDVWNDKHMEWDKLEVLLAGGARGSKILITARAELVARAARSNATHVLKGLSPEDSWVLFKQIAFKRGVEQVSPTMEGIGKEVLEKCVGVPLVVKVMASILALKKKEVDWLDFKKNDLPRVTQDPEGAVLPILRLSYEYLSASLKRCFVYCAIYPKDHEIEKEELIGMWVAHGLIQLDDTTRSIEEVGERHFMDLLDRSFFEISERRFYKMHDLIHDLAQSVGGDEYYNLGSGVKCMVKSTRHAWVSGDKLVNIDHEGEKLHTLVVTQSYDEKKFNELTSSIFQQLRVLRMRYLWLTSVPKFVGGLSHLYYLDLSHNNFVSLPESICSLYNLQTLILSYCYKLKELPEGIRDLGSLRRLDISGCGRLRYTPRGLEELTCLQTLSDFVCLEGGRREKNCAEVCELKSLVNLRGSLKIRNLRGSLRNEKFERERSCILVELKLITELELSWMYGWHGPSKAELLLESLKPHPNLERLIIKNYSGTKFPSWMDRVNIRISFPNIVYIEFGCCDDGGLQHVPPLGLLPSLQQLHLSWNDLEHLIDSSTLEEAEEPLFPSLKRLSLSYMRKLKRVVEPTESSGSTTNKRRYFPVLEKLYIWECPFFLGREEDGEQFVSLLELDLAGRNTDTIPSWLQYVPHLQTLTINHYDKIASLPDWMGNLTSLQELVLSNCRSLASFPDCMQRLTSLQRLWISECPEIVSLPDWMGNLTSLQELRLQRLYSLASIPDCLQRLTSLQRLWINECPEIVSLPDWMGNLTSLQELHLLYIRSLALIPDCMQRLTSLQRLRISGCPELESRCEKETGVDWHKIAHIPTIYVSRF